MSDKRPEILAPCQDAQHLEAAVQAGADAIYLGLKEFSARQRASNFTLAKLARAIPYCRKHGVKVYVAVNTVVKERELEQAGTYLAALSALEVDGLIVQDLGFAALARRFAPGLDLHASTQLAVHNLEGIRAASRLGFNRVILARELSAEEIKTLCAQSPLELEIFVHGSLCYCVSGLCLASSFLGGLSGNRGWCTQACRRPFQDGRGHVRYLFSMADLCLAEAGDLLRSLPVAAWKIEGRMKYPAYVRAAVEAYRLVREGRDAEARRILREVQTRPVTTGHIGRAEKILVPDRPGFTGIFLGKARKASNGFARLTLKHAVRVGQKLRCQSVSTDEGESFRLKKIYVGGRSCSEAHKGAKVLLEVPAHLSAGDLIFLVDPDPKKSFKFKEKPKNYKHRAREIEEQISAFLKEGLQVKAGRKRTAVTVETDDAAVARAAASVCGHVVLTVTDRLLHNISLSFLKKLKASAHVSVSVPPVCFPDRIEKMRAALEALASSGIDHFEINNLGALEIIPQGVKISVGPFLYVHNHVAALELLDKGAKKIVLPLETDLETLEALAECGPAPLLEVVIFAYVPLFVSRTRPPVKGRREVTDRFGERFVLRSRDGVTLLYGRRPFCAFSLRSRLQAAGIRNFRLSLPGGLFRAADVASLLRAFRRGEDVSGSTHFNLERGLR